MTTIVPSVFDNSQPGAIHTDHEADRQAHDYPLASRMLYSRLIGALFVLGFLFYGIGAALVTSATGAPDFLSAIPSHRNTLVLGAVLMLLNSLVEVGKGVLFFPILENHGKRTALAYLAGMIFEAVLLGVGVLALLTIVPLAQQSADAGQASAPWSQALGSLAVQSNTVAYQVAETALAVAGLFLCSLLFQSRLIPRSLAIAGLIGYASLGTGTTAEIFGIHIGLLLTIPGIVFELGLPAWLFVKGFELAAYAGRTETVGMTATVRPVA